MSARARIAVLIAASAVVLAACGSDDQAADPTPANGSTKHHGNDHTDSPEPSESTGETTDPVTVPVYFVGETPNGARLYREFRRVDAADPLYEALNLAVSGDALDPDYATGLPSGAFVSPDEIGDAGWFTLPDDSWTRLPEGMSERDALLAVQQLVYTAQGVMQSRDPIHFTDSSGAETQIFGIASEDGFTAADPIKTLALVNVTSPEEGATVSGSFTASGVSSSFEATTPWEIRQGGPDGKVVENGFSTAEGWMDKLYPWETDVDVSGLEPGDYTFVALTDDPSGGEGHGPTEDSKTITVH
jgi:major membrane immunogen (membrane-anchored lipoprotein)